MKSSRYLFKAFIIVTEAIIINLACKVAYFTRFGEFGEYDLTYFAFFIIFNLAWIGASLFNNAYDSDRVQNLGRFVRSLITTLFIHVFLVMLYIVSFKEISLVLSRWFIFYSYLYTLGGVIFYRGILITAYRYYNNVTYNIRKIAVVGSDSSVDELYRFFDSKDTTVYRFLEKVNPNLSKAERALLIQETIQELKAFCLREQVNEIYLSMNLVSDEIIDELSDFADNNFIYFRMVTSFDLLDKRPVNVDFFGHIPILSLRKEPLKVLINRIIKRAFDIFFSGMVITLVFPWLLPIIGILIKLESKGPIFFKQLRTGKNGEDFLCYKFRTMTVNQDSDSKQATKGDKRITKIGGILRKTSLDEFPQFLNVFMGHMSVVGPRPHMVKHTNEYSQIIDKYLYRHFIVPGITGHAQVNGYRGETNEPELMEKRVEYDTWYIENWSLFLDIKIIFLTVWNAVRGEENAY